ncbi:hypothetical protein [Baekduia sp.]|jgi:hypothetical protein|uniref:hypothetical protein n=1 Tax=Baekduia sp. TaxID=2600305 RepID=UPI002E00909C|nr:hypothetical protein [Baekduia sp.]
MLAAADTTVPIVAIITSGIVTPSIVAWYSLRTQKRQDRRTERDHQLALLEEGLNAISRERRLLHVGYSMWRHGATKLDLRVFENDKAITECIEEIWLAENRVRIRFGHHSVAATAFDALVSAAEDLFEVYSRHGTAQAGPTAQDDADWLVGVRDLVREQKRFVDATRDVAGLAPAGRIRRLRSSIVAWLPARRS